MRQKLRTLHEEDRARKSRTDARLPTCPIDLTDNEEPKRKQSRTDERPPAFA
jgi:hypothetical protein